MQIPLDHPSAHGLSLAWSWLTIKLCRGVSAVLTTQDHTHLVGRYVAHELGDGALGTHPQRVGGGVDEALVVRDQNDTALERLDCFSETVETLLVKMVGRLGMLAC